MIDIYVGDCRKYLRRMKTCSVRCVVTSPPYWGLRNYNMDDQIGLEPSVEAYIAELVAVFREMRRVLRADGTLWLNMGDAYYSPRVNGGVGVNSTINSHGNQASFRDAQRGHNSTKQQSNAGSINVAAANRRKGAVEIKDKDLIGLPWALAFALRADGWWLRQDIIWSKPNPMPESVRDRCTKAHEYLFLLSKQKRYAFNQEAILEPVALSSKLRMSSDVEHQAGSQRAHAGAKTNGPMKAVRRQHKAPRFGGSKYGDDVRVETRTKSGNEWNGAEMRNKRSVWTIPTAAFKDAHFATFPPALVEPCILAGSEPGGMVLDPFAGAGTVGLVAARLQRDAVLIELNPDYAQMAVRRIQAEAPLLTVVRMNDPAFTAPASESGPWTAHSAAPVSASS